MAKIRFTQEHLKSVIGYNPATGEFKKIKCKRTDWIGKIAGTHNRKGYRTVSIDNTPYLAHRLAWLYMTGEWPKANIDHINGIKDDNRFCNLRESNYSQDMHNQGKRKHNTSGYKGVTYNKNAKKWVAQIRINWEMKYLGLFTSPENAATAYNFAAEKYHGEFARLN